MLINLRNALMADKRTPQPVEYLESDGNQWFDITIPSRGSNTGAYIDYMIMEAGVNKGLFGSGKVNSSAQYDLKHILIGQGNQRFDRYDRSCRYRGFLPYAGQRQNFTFNPKGNNSSQQPCRYYSSLSGYKLQDDAWYTGSYAVTNSIIGVFYVFNRPDLLPAKIRLYDLELREYSSATVYTTTLKLTPVSVGGVGAMLDEITGETYFNMGTGDFVVGPRTRTNRKDTP